MYFGRLNSSQATETGAAIAKRKQPTEVGAKTKVADLYGLGPASQHLLNAAGIFTFQDLQELGPVAAYVAVIEAGKGPSLNLLWAIAGALSGIHWSELPAETRSALLLQYDAWCDQRSRKGIA